jgi:hypothetical protein
MNGRETLRLLEKIWELYPTIGSDRDITKTAKAWQEMFADDPYEDVSAAFVAYACQDERGYAPHVGALKELVWQKNHKPIPEAEAWAMVKQSLSGPADGACQRFCKLPDVIQRCVGDPATLRKWANVEEGELETVIGSTFKRAYRESLRQAKAIDKLPEHFKPMFRTDEPVFEYHQPAELPATNGVRCPQSVLARVKAELEAHE